MESIGGCGRWQREVGAEEERQEKGEAMEVKRSRYVIKEGSQTDAVKGTHYSDLLHPKTSNAERPDKNTTKTHRNRL